MANTITDMTAEEYINHEVERNSKNGVKVDFFRTDTILCKDGILVSDTSDSYIRYDFIPFGIMKEVIKRSLNAITISMLEDSINR